MCCTGTGLLMHYYESGESYHCRMDGQRNEKLDNSSLQHGQIMAFLITPHLYLYS